jgi:hypothetical protein
MKSPSMMAVAEHETMLHGVGFDYKGQHKSLLLVSISLKDFESGLSSIALLRAGTPNKHRFAVANF